MLYLIERKIKSSISEEFLTDHFTIWKHDRGEFLTQTNNFFEDNDSAFRIIYDEDEQKEIIKGYLSHNRGENYDEEKTSVSIITGKLYPLNIATDMGLVNNFYRYQTLEKYYEQNELNTEAQEKGNNIHKVLERWLCDKKHFSLKNIHDYIKDEEYKDIVIKALTEYKKYKERGSVNYSSENYIKDQLYKADIVYSEIFVNNSDLGIQGCVDCLIYTPKGLVLKDFKSTSKLDKKTGKGVFKSLSQMGNYKRQMFLYAYMMMKQGFITKNEWKKLQYNNDVFHFPREQYREYYYNTTNLKEDLKNILHVISWFHTILGN